MKVALAALLAALVLSGCGGDDTSSSAASVVPADAAAFVEVDSDLGSDQWQQLDELLRKFPGRDDLLREIRDGLAKEELSWERDVDPALGETTAVVWLDFKNDGENVVGITKPDDKEKFRQLLAKLDEDSDQTTFSRDVGEWTVVAETEALLDRVDDDRALAADSRYTEALADLPDPRLATAYVDVTKASTSLKRLVQGDGLGTFGSDGLDKIESFAAALAAEDKGFDLSFWARFSEDAESLGVEAYDSRFVDEVPGDAFLFASFSGATYQKTLEDLPQAERDELREFEAMLGISVEELLALLEGEGALYARPGALIPEVTLLLETDDEQEAVATVDRLVRRAAGGLGGGAPRTQTIEGVEVQTLQLGPVGVNYGAFDGKLVVSLATTAFEALQSDDEKLADAEDFKEAAEAAGLPDETAGFFYLNVQDLLPTLETILGFAGAESADVPPEIVENVRPIRSLVGYATEDGREARSVVFVHIE